MRDGRWERFAPLTGVLFVVLVVPVFFLGGEPPEADESTAEVVDFWTSNDDELIIGALLSGLGLVFFLWFLGSLRSSLRVAEGGTGRLSAVVFGSGLVLAAAAGIASGIQFAAADSAGDVPPEVTQTLSVMNIDMFVAFAASLMALMAAAGLVILRTGVLPSWLGWIALLIAIVEVTPIGFFAFFVFFAWVLVVSVLLYRGQPAVPAPSPPPDRPVASPPDTPAAY